jgi:hypothetical protein
MTVVAAMVTPTAMAVMILRMTGRGDLRMDRHAGCGQSE